MEYPKDKPVRKAIRVFNTQDLKTTVAQFEVEGFSLDVDTTIKKLKGDNPKADDSIIFPVYVQICWLPWCGDYLRVWDKNTVHHGWVDFE